MLLRSLQLSLKLEPKGATPVEVPGGNIERFRADVAPWGFEAEVAFWFDVAQTEDPLFDVFTGTKLIHATLTAQEFRAREGVRIEPIVVQGPVAEKALREIVDSRVEGRPVLLRRYTVRFADPARVLWRQHFPCAVLADASLHDLIEGQNVDGVKLRFEWDALETKHRMLCLPLGDEKNEASFYDFVWWLVAAENGVLSYDGKANAYTFRKEKLSSEGEAPPFERGATARVELLPPEPPRRAARVLNSHTESVATEQVPNDDAIAGVRRDALLDTPIAAAVTARKTVEAARLLAPHQALAVTLRKLSAFSLRPGSFVKFERGFSEKTWQHGKEFRVRRVLLEGRATARDAQSMPLGKRLGSYEGRIVAVLEEKDDPRPALPPFRAPRWPIYAEGRIVSEQGEPNDRTFHAFEDASTSLHSYFVQIPLFNAKVPAPFAPEVVPGHFFIPAWKNHRVLVRLEFKDARIIRFLDWGEGVRLPADTQGNHILLGKNAKSETSIKHHYVDQKPVLSILRTNDKDKQRIELSEGDMTLEVKEDTAAAAVEPKYDVTVQVENARAELTAGVAAGATKIASDYGAAEAQLSAAVEKASEDIGNELGAAAAEISAEIQAARGELAALRGEVQGSVAEIQAKAEEAKAKLEAAIEE